MKYLEYLLGGVYGLLIWAILFTLKMFFIVSGPLVAGVPIAICHYLDRETLWIVFWPWDNKESGYHNRGFGDDYKDPLNREGGDADIFRRWHIEGKSWLKIALEWSLKRNPANNMTRVLACKLKDLTRSVFSYTSLQKYDGQVFESDRGRFTARWYSSPFPHIIRAVLKDKWYFDIQLAKSKYFYFPMIRAVKCFPEKYYTTRKYSFFVKKKENVGGIKKLFNYKIIDMQVTREKKKKHIEIIIGFKIYSWMVHFALKNEWPWMSRSTTRQAAINIVYREDKDWA